MRRVIIVMLGANSIGDDSRVAATTPQASELTAARTALDSRPWQSRYCDQPEARRQAGASHTTLSANHAVDQWIVVAKGVVFQNLD